MAQYKWVNANVTNGSATVTLVGVDATAEIAAGAEFIVVGNGVPYVVSATPTLSGSDTLATLSTTYAGITASGVSVTFQRDYTTDGIPILYEGDVETGTIMGKLAMVVQSLFTSLLAGTTPFSNPAAVRTQLVAGGMHKTNSRPVAADLNAGDKWADIDYGTNVCAVYCIVDPATPALDSLEAFVATADGKWLPLDNSEPTTIDCSAGGTVTITALQNAYGGYNLTGTPAAAFNLVVSTTKRTFTVSNASGQTATVKTSGGTGIDVPANATVKLRSDGTNVVFDEDVVNVPANTNGNVSRLVMSTVTGGTGTENGSNTWAKIATFTPPTTNFTNKNVTLCITGGAKEKASITLLSVSMRQETAGFTSANSLLSVISCTNTDILGHDSFLLVSAATTNGTAVELWMKKKNNYNKFDVTEISSNETASLWTTVYNNNASWQSTTPTGAISLTSSWSGSGWIDITPQNGWTGADVVLRYRYYDNGDVDVHFSTTTTIGTLTNATLLGTLPDHFPDSVNELPFQVAGQSGAQFNAGQIYIHPTTGQMKIYGFVSSSYYRAHVRFKSK